MELGGPQSVKVLSPEMLSLMEGAEVICNTTGHTLRRVNGEWRRGTRGRRPVRAYKVS